MSYDYLSPQDISIWIKQLSLKEDRFLTDPRLQITFDDLARQKALELYRQSGETHGKPQLRVYIEGKGCDGFYYGVAFDRQSQSDFICTTPEIDILIDSDSLMFLYGSKVTWIKVDQSEGFLVENPHHERFRGKFFKKSAWKSTLLQG